MDERSLPTNARGAVRRDAKTSLVRGVLVVDIGGSSVKILASGHKVHRSFPSGPKMTPKDMVSGVKKLAADWAYGGIAHPCVPELVLSRG